MGGPGLGGTDPEGPAGASAGRAQRGLASRPAAIQWGAGAAGTSLRAGAALPQRSPRTRGRGAGGSEAPLPPRAQPGRRSPHPAKPRRPAPTLLGLTSSRVWGRLHCDTNLAIEGLHSLHVVDAEAPSPAAEEAAATTLGGESETEAAAQPREGAAARGPAAATPGREGTGRPWRGRDPLGAARPRHGREGGRSADLGNTGAAGRVGGGRGRGWAAAPSLLRPAPSRPSALQPCPLPSPPPSSSSFDRLLFHLPAARAAGTSSARRRRRRKRWQQRLRHPIWRKRVGPRSSGTAAPASAPPGGWTARPGRRRRYHRGSGGPERRRPETGRPASGLPAPRRLPGPGRRGAERRSPRERSGPSFAATAKRCWKKTPNVPTKLQV